MADPFQPKFVDLVRNTTTTTGTGNFTLGPAVSGYTSFTAACQVGDGFYYSAIGIDKPQEREVGRGTLLAGGQISRDPIGGAKTNFTNGTKSVALIAAAEWYQAAQQLMAAVSPFGQALASASSAALARGTLGLGQASMLDSDADATLSGNSDTKVPTQKAVKAYVDSRQPAGALMAANNLADVASASSARSNLGIGSAALEPVSRFPVTIADRVALAAYSATSTTYLRENGREGLFVWDGSNQAANVGVDSGQGIYVAPASDPTGASGAWVRKFSGAVSVKWFGARGDGASNDGAAFAAAIAVLKRIGAALVNGPYHQASPTLYIPAGNYYLGTTTLDITHTLVIEGEGVFGGAGNATRLTWAADTTGIRIQRYDTADVALVDNVSTHFGGDGTSIRGLALFGDYSGTEGEYHGIHAKAQFCLEGCHIQNFAGDGIYANATAGSGAAYEGNANNVRITNCSVASCRNGLFVDGADTNIWTVIGLNAYANRRWNVCDSSFLGNTYVGCHTATGGWITGSIPTTVTFSGNRYCVKKNQEAGASTNAPSGTTADNVWWYYLGAGGTNPAFNINAWVSGASYRDGGSYRADGEGNAGTVFCGCYSEGDQPPAQIDYPALVMGSSMSNQVKGVSVLIGGPDIYSHGGGLKADGGLSVYGSGHNIGPQSGSSDNVVSLSTANSFAQVQGVRWPGGTTIGSLGFYYGFGNIHNVSNSGWSHKFRINGTDTVVISSTGLTSVAGITSSGGGIGYTTGAGGTVAQATSKSTGVTLNKLCGQITMNAAALAANAGVSFAVTNSQVAATDTIDLCLASGNAAAGTYNYQVDKVSAGSFVIWVRNISGSSLSEALVFNFSVKKAVAA
jgi:hypothetical protein